MVEYIGDSHLFNGMEQGLRFAIDLLESLNNPRSFEIQAIIDNLKIKQQFAIDCKEIRQKHERQQKRIKEMFS